MSYPRRRAFAFMIIVLFCVMCISACTDGSKYEKEQISSFLQRHKIATIDQQPLSDEAVHIARSSIQRANNGDTDDIFAYNYTDTVRFATQVRKAASDDIAANIPLPKIKLS